MKKSFGLKKLNLRSFKYWGRTLALTVCALLVGLGIFAVNSGAFADVPGRVRPPSKVTFYGSPASSISSGVALPPRSAIYYSSGTVPPVLNPRGATALERYGDTYTQAKGTLERIKGLLAEQGLSLSNVVYLTCYLVPDPNLNGRVDYNGWFRAYAEYFNNPTNPVKTARSTLGVQGLVNSDWLVEIEAIAVYPNP